MKISPARTAAFDVLLRIETANAYSSILLPQFEAELAAIDRPLCHEIVLGVLRRKLYLDRLIDTLAAERRLDVEVRVALRIGIFQMLFLDRVPTHSAINESVELTVRAKKSSAKGFVNAILRKLQRDRPVLNFDDEIERLSIETSHPRWLVTRWIRQFGAAETQELCDGNNRYPITGFRIVGDHESRSKIEREIADIQGVSRSAFVQDCYLTERSSERLRELSDRGEIYFQDEGSQLVGQAVIAVSRGRLLDVCSAPGGKTSQIASRTSALVVAGDLHFNRLRKVVETCKKLRVQNVAIARYDACHSLPFEQRTFDTIFVDAPCSGTGTIQQNPELRYSPSESDIQELASKQLLMLQNASELVAPKGTLIYSTCSMESDENEQVSNKFVEANRDFEAIIPDVPSQFVTTEGFVRTKPYRDRMGGFFISGFRRH